LDVVNSFARNIWVHGFSFISNDVLRFKPTCSSEYMHTFLLSTNQGEVIGLKLCTCSALADTANQMSKNTSLQTH
jgi:putative component of membrane protein insertase Oxa1/YidC/SpoIIIJ protein YidD